MKENKIREIVGEELRNRSFGIISSIILIKLSILLFRTMEKWEPSEVFNLFEFVGMVICGSLMVPMFVSGLVLFIMAFTKEGLRFK